MNADGNQVKQSKADAVNHSTLKHTGISVLHALLIYAIDGRLYSHFSRASRQNASRFVVAPGSSQKCQRWFGNKNNPCLPMTEWLLVL